MPISKFAGRLAASAIVLTVCANGALAHDYRLGALKITHPWVRRTPPSAPTAAGYLTIDNTGANADRLASISSPDASAVEIHEDSMSGGVMRMRAVADGLTIPAHGSVKLEPGAYHLMFIGPKRPFRAGDRIPATLRFDHGGTVCVDLAVEQAAMGGGSMSGMNMPGMH